jgi:hypothetical protein
MEFMSRPSHSPWLITATLKIVLTVVGVQNYEAPDHAIISNLFFLPVVELHNKYKIWADWV